MALGEKKSLLKTKVQEMIERLEKDAECLESVVGNLHRIPLHITVEGEDVIVRVVKNKLAVIETGPVPEASAVVLESTWEQLEEIAEQRPPLDVLIETGKIEIKPPLRFTGFKQFHEAILKWYLAIEQTRGMELTGERSTNSATQEDRFIPWSHDPSSGKNVVTVIGGGIAGLTAAHELVERGFNVQVVEMESSTLRPDTCAVGGIAKTQWARLPTEIKGTLVGSADPLVFRAFFVLDHADEPAVEKLVLEDASAGMLKRAAAELAREIGLSVFSYSKKDELPRIVEQDGRPKTLRWTIEVRRQYNPLDPIPSEQEVLLSARKIAATVAKAILSEKSLSKQPGSSIEGPSSVDTVAFEPVEQDPATIKVTWTRQSQKLEMFFTFRGVVTPISFAWHQSEIHELMVRRVEFRVSQELAAAEHGYRFFPSFYRHMFDTMKRIPLYDDLGRETGKTAMDNLVPPEVWRMMDWKEKRGPETFERRAPKSFEEVRLMLKKLRSFGYTNRDVALFEIRIFKYLTSSKERRRQEAENVSWREYLNVDDFSEPFRRFLDDAPLSLLAMKSMDIDARTNMNVGIQLFLDQLTDGSRADLTLNGPTSEALFYPWMDYLRRQGVRFFRGTLKDFTIDANGQLKPVFEVRYDCQQISEASAEDLRRMEQGTHHRSGQKKRVFRFAPEGEYSKPTPAQEPVWPAGCGGDFSPNSEYYVLAIPLEQIWKLMRDNDGKGTEAVKWEGDFQLLNLWRKEVEKKAEARHCSWNIDGLVPRNEKQEIVGPFRDMTGIQFYFHQGVRVGGKGHIYYVEAPWGLSSISQPQYWRNRRRPATGGYISNLSVDVCNLTEPGTNGKTAIFCTADEFAKESWKQIHQAQTYPFPIVSPAFYHLDRNLDWDPDKGHHTNTTPFLINLPGDWVRRPGVDPYPPDETEREAFQKKTGQPWIRYNVSHKNWILCGPHMKTFTRLTTMEAANESARHAVNRLLYHFAQSHYLMGEFCDVWDIEECEPLDVLPLKKLDERLVTRKNPLPHFVDILQLESLANLAEPIDPFDRLKELMKVAQDTARADTLMGQWSPGVGWLNAMDPSSIVEKLEAKMREYIDIVAGKK